MRFPNAVKKTNALGRLRFDHVGVEGPLDQKSHVVERSRLFFKDCDELVTDRDALALGIDDPGQALEKAPARIDGDDLEVQDVAKRAEDAGRLVGSQ